MADPNWLPSLFGMGGGSEGSGLGTWGLPSITSLPGFDPTAIPAFGDVWNPQPAVSPPSVGPTQVGGAPEDTPAGTTPAAGTQAAKGPSALAQALRGVTAPAAPVAQKVNTPSGAAEARLLAAPAPLAPKAIQGGNFLELLQALNLASHSMPQTQPVSPRLSQALGVR